jgi:hypothetical protein
MSERHAVGDAPHGSPEAGPVRVWRYDPEQGCYALVREEDPWDSDLAAGTTLPAGPGQAWVRKAEGPGEEDAGDEASWADDRSDD